MASPSRSGPQTGAARAYWQGFAAGFPFILVVGPFALLFGVVGTEAGLNIAEVMGFSVVVIAGAAQFTALQLMTEQAPTIIVLASALAVNLRMAMYSASLAPHLGALPIGLRAFAAYLLLDQSYAVSHLRFEEEPDMPLVAKFTYFMGAVSPVVPIWYGATWLGAVLGTRIPPELALDFAVPVTFLAIIAPALRSAAHISAALVATGLALGLAWMPFNLGMLVAAIAGIIVGAEVERRGYGVPPL